jgi:hypothetical protein
MNNDAVNFVSTIIAAIFAAGASLVLS